MSVFDNRAYPEATKFSSVLSIDLTGIIDLLLVHVLYGMSKDFCGNGLRLGTLHSRNPALRAAVMGIAYVTIQPVCYRELTLVSAFGWEAYIVQDIWARILEDKPFLDNFISENQKRLAARYNMVTDFLRKNNIAFFEGGNAGVFIWIDLRDWFRGQHPCGDDNGLLVSASDNSIYRAMESSLGRIWWDQGVMISKGTSYMTEELGWFRIVFTVDEDCLKAGLDRFVDGLNEAAAASSTLPN